MPLPPSMGLVSPDTSHRDREQEEREATKIGGKTYGALQYVTYHNEIPPIARQDCGGGQYIC